MRLAMILMLLGSGVVSAGSALVPEKPTFSKDIAPMSLLTYKEVRPWVKSIQKNVEAGTMPPWHASLEHGSFANDRSLAPHERETILKWAKIGGPKGKSADLPERPSTARSGWKLGEPDLVVTFGKVKVPAGGADKFYDLIKGYEIDEDKYVRAVEILPGNRKVVHHVIVYQTDLKSAGPQGWLGAWAAGTDPMVFPEGTARVLKKGQKLVDGPPEKPPVPIYLPKSGDGLSTVVSNGTPVTCAVEDIVWDGDRFTCNIVVTPQVKLTVEGTFDPATGEVSYVAKTPDGTAFKLVGKLAE